MYAIVVNNVIQGTGELLTLFPNVSFPTTGPDSEFLTTNNLVLVKTWEEFDPANFNSVDIPFYIRDGLVYSYELVEKTEIEKAEYQVKLSNIKSIELRDKRNQLLKDSDWTQVADAPVDKTAWATYRQALRDITYQEGFPFNVIFPNPPL